MMGTRPGPPVNHPSGADVPPVTFSSEPGHPFYGNQYTSGQSGAARQEAALQRRIDRTSPKLAEQKARAQAQAKKQALRDARLRNSPPLSRAVRPGGFGKEIGRVARESARMKK